MKQKTKTIVIVISILVVTFFIIFLYFIYYFLGDVSVKKEVKENIQYQDLLDSPKRNEELQEKSIAKNLFNIYIGKNISQVKNSTENSLNVFSDHEYNIHIELRGYLKDERNLLYNKIVNEDRVNISVTGINKKNANIVCRIEDKLLCPFTFSNIGNDIITVSLLADDGNLEESFFVSTKKSDFLQTPLGITEKNILFQENALFSLKEVKIIPRYYWHIEDHIYNSHHPQTILNLPETLRFDFASNNKVYLSNIYLEIYPLDPEIFNSQYYQENQERFPSYIYDISQFLKDETLELDEFFESRGIGGMYSFRMPIDRRALSQKSYIETDDFLGIRYLSNYAPQAVGPVEHPMYNFEGITKDQKYFVLFRYKKLHSPLLAEFYDNDPCGIDIVEKQHNCYTEKSFPLLNEEENFIPSLGELDTFIKSIEILQ